MDTEGPLYESPEVKFQRLEEYLGISGIAPTSINLELIRQGELDLGGREQDARNLLGDHNQNFMDDWSKVDEMLDRVTDPQFRNRMTDSFGGGWVFNWFCLDHVNYDYNPRRRATGFHAVFDHYRQRLLQQSDCSDALHWHFHPMSTYRDAHNCATHYFRSPEIFEILSRKVIERQWFPVAFRAGFQAERPDSNWFLEQWIPFDTSNMAVADPAEFDAHVDFRNGRSGDWRQAPADWSVYHPSHDNYQVPGHCRRLIARSLNVFNRIANLDQPEMDKAFARAAEGLPTLVGVANHDYRDMEPEIEYLRDLIAVSAKKYPDVPFMFDEAVNAFQAVAFKEGDKPAAVDLELHFRPAGGNDVAYVEIVCAAGEVFGPQPFLAIETKSRRFIHDNLDFSPSGRKWYYAFHGDTLPLEDVVRIGIAANDRYGNQCIRQLDLTGITS
ncbi:MAG: hypothetical protein HQ503_18985 [Rhodospirillales bacterium]|nr:hypothetical protein [Rhodospirillales bacterium]